MEVAQSISQERSRQWALREITEVPLLSKEQLAADHELATQLAESCSSQTSERQKSKAEELLAINETPPSSMFGTPDTNEEKNKEDTPLAAQREVFMDAQRQMEDTRGALSGCCSQFAQHKQSTENQLTQDNKAISRRTIRSFPHPWKPRELIFWKLR